MVRNRLRRLQFESLEQRQQLAGDVSVGVAGGQLFITGDLHANDIVLTSTGNPGEFRVASGVYSFTTVNGGVAPVTVGGVTSHVFINLGEGNNQVIFDSNPAAINFAGNLRIDMGAGWDALQAHGLNNISVAGSFDFVAGDGVNNLYLEKLYVGANLIITLGSSLDHLVLNSGSVGGAVGIDSGAEDDTVYMELAVAGSVFLNGTGEDQLWLADMVTPTAIGGSLFVAMDQGSLNLFNVNIGYDLVVNGNGNVRVGYSDIHRDVNLTLTTGHSSVSFGPIASVPDMQQFGGDFTVTLGALGGDVAIDSANIAHNLIINGGDANNNINLTNVRAASSFTIDAGGGNDTIRVQSASADGDVQIFGGNGGDYVSVNNFRAANNFQVDTAEGYDYISLAYCGIGRTVSVRSGSESDQIVVSAVSAQNLWLDSAAGYDGVRIEYSAFYTLFAQLGADSDSLTLRANRVRIATALDGGGGHDLLTGGGNLLTGLNRRNFEAA
jgi:hypothetical protein